MNDAVNLSDLVEKDVLSFDEVSRFPGMGFTGSLQKAMRREVANPGIKITEDEDGITINCEIIVYFGVNIPQLCYDIQSRVKKDIEEKTGLDVKAINIRVEGLDKEKQ